MNTECLPLIGLTQMLKEATTQKKSATKYFFLILAFLSHKLDCNLVEQMLKRMKKVRMSMAHNPFRKPNS